MAAEIKYSSQILKSCSKLGWSFRHRPSCQSLFILIVFSFLAFYRTNLSLAETLLVWYLLVQCSTQPSYPGCCLGTYREMTRENLPTICKLFLATVRSRFCFKLTLFNLGRSVKTPAEIWLILLPSRLISSNDSWNLEISQRASFRGNLQRGTQK